MRSSGCNCLYRFPIYENYPFEVLHFRLETAPKGADLSVHDQDSLDAIADLLNNRPRQTLDWLSPYQKLKQFMQAIEQKQGATIH